MFTFNELETLGSQISDDNNEKLAVKDRNLEEVASIIYINEPISKLEKEAWADIKTRNKNMMPKGLCVTRISILGTLYNLYTQYG